MGSEDVLSLCASLEVDLEDGSARAENWTVAVVDDGPCCDVEASGTSN